MLVSHGGFLSALLRSSGIAVDDSLSHSFANGEVRYGVLTWPQDYQQQAKGRIFPRRIQSEATAVAVAAEM